MRAPSHNDDDANLAYLKMGFGGPALQLFRFIYTQDNQLSTLGIKKVIFEHGSLDLESTIAKIPELKRLRNLLQEMFSRKLPGYGELHEMISESLDELVLHLGVEVPDPQKWVQNFIKCFILSTRKYRDQKGFDRHLVRLRFAKLFYENKDCDASSIMRSMQVFCIEEGSFAETEFCRILQSDNTEDLEVKYQSWVRSFERVDLPATFTNLPPFVR